MPMLPCSECLENSWNIAILEDGWMKAECKFCGSEVQFVAKKKVFKKVMTDEDPCPRCQSKLHWRQHKENWRPKPRQPFYFKKWLECSSCGFIQLSEAEKVYVKQTYDPTRTNNT